MANDAARRAPDLIDRLRERGRGCRLTTVARDVVLALGLGVRGAPPNIVLDVPGGGRG